MIEETSSSGCESTEEFPVMEVSNSHRGVRRSRGSDVPSSGAGKRRRVDSQEPENVDLQLKYHSRSEIDVNFHENVVLMALSDHASSFICSINHDSRSPDLKCISETEIFMSRDHGFSRETSAASSVVSLESEEMESSSTSTPNKKKKKKKKKSNATTNEATSGRKPPPPTKIPVAELEQFFLEAEKYQQKRFSEKYNYDIEKDVPMEGRYQWVRLKP